MEVNFNNGRTLEALKEIRDGNSIIEVKAYLSCHNCGYKKTFKNKFMRSNIEEMVVSLKIFDWMTCKCGELLHLDLEFII